MHGFVYRCPRTGTNVQGWADEGEAEPMNCKESYVGTHWLACNGLHFIDRRTGKVLGPDRIGEKP
jgi:hypothetical protein